MYKRVDEQLKEINDAKTVDERVSLLKTYGASKPLNMILSLNFDDRLILDLPEGPPVYNRDESTHSDLQGKLVHHISKISNCFKQSKLKRFKKEYIFIEVVENINPQEADVLIFAKDKALEELYPNITKELVGSIFPGYVH